MAKMSDDEFVSLVKRRRDDALAHLTDNLASDRRRALQYYRGDNLSEYGNSGDGLSTLVSRDMMEAVESILPGLVKPFIAGDETVRFEPTGPEDEEPAKQATEYINYLFQNHNDAVRVIYDFTKDGLMFRLGVAKVVFEEVDDKKLETYQGLGPDQLKALEASDDHEIVGDIMQAEDGSFEVKCSCSVKKPTFRVYVIAPDEFMFEPRLANMDEGRFFGHRATKPAGDFVAMGLDKDKVLALRKDGDSEDDDDRFRGEQDRDDGRQDEDLARLVTIDECYIRCDRDDAGMLAWRKVMIGANDDEILLDEEADDHPYETWTPIPLPHKLVGMSVFDLTKDLQEHGTAVLREMSNAMYLSNRPQREVVEGQVNFEDMLSPEVGGIVRVKQVGMIREIPSGGEGVMQQAMATLELIATQREQRTGSTRYNQGMDSNSLNKTATGISIIQNASQQRQELVARHLAEGIKGVFKKLLGLVCRHLDKQQVIRLRGKWVEMDVTSWKDSYDMSVAVGLGTGNRDQQVGQLHELLLLDEKIIELQQGLSGPLLTAENVYEKLKRLTEAMGLKGIENYYTDPAAKDEGEQQQPEQPPPNPEAEAQAMQQQHEQQQAQQQVEADGAKQQADHAHEADCAQVDAETKVQMAQIDADAKVRIAEIQAQQAVEVAANTPQPEPSQAAPPSVTVNAVQPKRGPVVKTVTARDENGLIQSWVEEEQAPHNEGGELDG